MLESVWIFVDVGSVGLKFFIVGRICMYCKLCLLCLLFDHWREICEIGSKFFDKFSGVRGGNHSRDASRRDLRRHFGDRDGDRDQIDLRLMVSMRRPGLRDPFSAAFMRRLHAPSERVRRVIRLLRRPIAADDGRRAGIRNASADPLPVLL